jgi:hypothetical protein
MHGPSESEAPPADKKRVPTAGGAGADRRAGVGLCSRVRRLGQKEREREREREREMVRGYRRQTESLTSERERERERERESAILGFGIELRRACKVRGYRIE